MQVAMTLLTHCGKALLALDDMEQVVHYLKAEVASCTAHICKHTPHAFIMLITWSMLQVMRSVSGTYLVPTYSWPIQLKDMHGVWSIA